MAEGGDINTVSLKLPSFWPANAEVWFQQAEAQFALRNITSNDTKYFHILSALDQDTATLLLDLLRAPPAGNKYQAIKDRLLNTFTLSDYEKAGHLLNLPGLGSDMPSTLMDKMLALLGNHPPCFLFKRIFYDQMPEDIRTVLVQANIDDCRELAQMADRLWLARQPTTAAISSPSNEPKKGKEGYCWYHAKFGNKALRCLTPCTFPVSKTKGNDNAGCLLRPTQPANL